MMVILFVPQKGLTTTLLFVLQNDHRVLFVPQKDHLVFPPKRTYSLFLKIVVLFVPQKEPLLFILLLLIPELRNNLLLTQNCANIERFVLLGFVFIDYMQNHE